MISLGVAIPGINGILEFINSLVNSSDIPGLTIKSTPIFSALWICSILITVPIPRQILLL